MSAIFNFIQQKSSVSISGEVDANGESFRGVQTPAEINELRLRTPRPVATSK
jgi:hypothetical protein